MEYLLTGSHLLDDTAFARYGGDTGTDEIWQRQIAYEMAERSACEYIGTFIIPNTVTQTYDLPVPRNRVLLRYWPVHSVDLIEFIDEDDGATCDETVSLDGCYKIIDRYRAVVELQSTSCYCSGSPRYSKVRISYTAGYSNLAVDTKAMMGLSTVAKLYLEQLVDPHGAEGGIGDPGLTSFSDNGHSESRVAHAVKDTVFGSSPTANFAAKLLKHLRSHRPISFRGNR